MILLLIIILNNGMNKISVKTSGIYGPKTSSKAPYCFRYNVHMNLFTDDSVTIAEFWFLMTIFYKIEYQ